MPTLNWIGKEAVVNHHQQVPFHLLKDVPEQVVVNCDHLARLIKVAQCEVKVDAALSVAAKYAITGYDAQYVALAQSLNAPLITEDRKLRNAVLGIAFSTQEFLAQ
jgi:predicted nucleic acid-binding protein